MHAKLITNHTVCLIENLLFFERLARLIFILDLLPLCSAHRPLLLLFGLKIFHGFDLLFLLDPKPLIGFVLLAQLLDFIVHVFQLNSDLFLKFKNVVRRFRRCKWLLILGYLLLVHGRCYVHGVNQPNLEGN